MSFTTSLLWLRQQVRKDLFRLLDRFPVEAIQQTRLHVLDGRIDGNWYGGCHCADCRNRPRCLIGWLCQATGGDVDDYTGDGLRPIECYIEAVRPGETPATSEQLAQVLVWLDEYLQARTKPSLSMWLVATARTLVSPVLNGGKKGENT